MKQYSPDVIVNIPLATIDILKKCRDSQYVIDVLDQTAVWDEVDCDGYCLMEEIAEILEIEERK